jgi:hypothetical protein
MVNIKRILCPVDLSQFSGDDLHHALALARWYEAQVGFPFGVALALVVSGGRQ